jgi:putative Holliday junction resolvase
VNGRRILAIDHGKVRLGLAVSDPERKIASPLTNYTRKDLDQDARFLKEVIATEDAGLAVIGLPVHLSGHEGDQAVKARAFGKWLHERTGISCVYYDERFSTHEAEASLWSAGLTHKKRKARRDQVAAQMLLQAFLDAGCPLDATPGPLE